MVACPPLALEGVCETLGLRLIDDPATRLVAQKIIELRQRGLRGNTLREMTLEAFKYAATPQLQILRTKLCQRSCLTVGLE